MKLNSAGQPINAKGQFISGSGGESGVTVNGRLAHEKFKVRVKEKPGWQSSPQLIDPKTGKTVIPDAVSPSGRPVELKPATPSGAKKGSRQIKKYERATGKKGRVIFYDPLTGELLPWYSP